MLGKEKTKIQEPKKPPKKRKGLRKAQLTKEELVSLNVIMERAELDEILERAEEKIPSKKKKKEKKEKRKKKTEYKEKKEKTRAAEKKAKEKERRDQVFFEGRAAAMLNHCLAQCRRMHNFQ